ncbi:retrovirus-related pol polyprotein from transposon TNT 1-94 [Tanacetum coccineum]|uniref:Retrovirus-related pol polyprotein from transposon TNT 1-94 n=1 Tax=Tanacetum coccineum TaxID=301880 RepID=A0ABQ5F4F6_9ASTR
MASTAISLKLLVPFIQLAKQVLLRSTPNLKYENDLLVFCVVHYGKVEAYTINPNLKMHSEKIGTWIFADYGTEFVIQTLKNYYEDVGISRQTSVARTPQQNGTVKRRNKTLVEASCTMLIFLKAPLVLWVEGVEKDKLDFQAGKGKYFLVLTGLGMNFTQLLIAYVTQTRRCGQPLKGYNEGIDDVQGCKGTTCKFPPNAHVKCSILQQLQPEHGQICDSLSSRRAHEIDNVSYHQAVCRSEAITLQRSRRFSPAESSSNDTPIGKQTELRSTLTLMDLTYFAPMEEETVTLEKESRSKLDKDTVKPYNYTYQNSLYETFKPPSKAYLDQLECAKEVRKSKSNRTMKNNPVCKENALNVFRKEREQYHEIQDLKAQMQDKNMVINELKKLILVKKGKSVETQFDKPHVVRQPNALRIPKPSVNSRTSVSRPQLKKTAIQVKEKVRAQTLVQVKFTKMEVVQTPELRIISGVVFVLEMISVLPILGYGDLIQGEMSRSNGVFYVRWPQITILFSCGLLCMLDLEVAFRKSTCCVRSIQGNDLLTGSRGSDLYTISLQETTSSTPICFMAKASPTQAWLWHRRLSHLNFDYITLLSKKEVVNGLPKENGVVERRNRTLVEAARTMLSASKLPLSFWAEAVATACYTQNRSIIISTHGKTAYHIINDRKPSIKHLHIFGCICYITRDGENLDKMKEKGDPCVMVGYSTQSKGYRVYNKRTRLIVESIHIKFDEIKEMMSDHNSSDLAPQRQEMSVENVSSGLVPQGQKASDYDNSDPVPPRQNVVPTAEQ